MGEIKAQVKLILVVLRLHVGTQLVEGLVVLLLAQMGEFVHNDHAQKLFRRLLEHRRNANLVFSRQPTALHTGY
ncbi:hypothetical protein D3C71_2052900 [compost metagenome]